MVEKRANQTVISCSVLEEKVGCVGRTVASCDQDVREPLEATVELIRAETNRFCEDDYGFGQPVTGWFM